MRHRTAAWGVLAICPVLLAGCISFGGKPRNYAWSEERVLTVTAYCDCKRCTGWKRNWRGRAVFANGENKGERKRVGITASGTRARRGTIAADTARYPFGTIMYVPGYGYGTVEDRGSAIQGDHIDLFFGSHADAMRWGRQSKRVTVYAMR